MPAASKSKRAPPKPRTTPEKPPAKTRTAPTKPTPKPRATPDKPTPKARKEPAKVAPKPAPEPAKPTPEVRKEPVRSAPKVEPPPPEPAPEEAARPPSRPAALTEAAEALGESFEEALLERLAQEDGRGWRAGPVVALPMDRLAAGHLGWMTTLSAPGIFTLGTIHLFVIPGDTRDPPTELPLLDADWDQFDSVEHFAGPPRLLLLARARDPVKKPDVSALAHQVFERLKSELSPERSRRAARSE